MSFLDRIKAPGRPTHKADDGADAGRAAPPFDDSAALSNPMEATVRLGHSAFAPGAARSDTDSSIISEAMPSELATDSAQPDVPAGPEATASGLPLIGSWPLARQQRWLVTLFTLGLLGLLLTAVLAFSAGGRGAAQLAAASQAATQSQRLARSATQALAGDEKAFAAVAESSQALAGSDASRNARAPAQPASPHMHQA